MGIQQTIFMTFKLIEKGRAGTVLEDYEVRINRANLRMGKALAKLFVNFPNLYGAEVYFDEEKKLLALKPSKNRLIAYSMGSTERNRKIPLLSVHSTKLVKFIKGHNLIGVYTGRIKEAMVIVDLKKKKFT